MKSSICGGVLALAVTLAPQIVRAQAFTNLGFESANVSGYSPGNYMPVSAALPGWAAYYGTSNNPTYDGAPVFYDGLSLGGALVVLEVTNAPSGIPLPIQGNYSVLLEGSIPAAASTASIGQTGTIPITAQSLSFDLGNSFGTVQISFSGQALSFVAISNALNYTVYGADISPFAGQTGQLLFTAPVDDHALLDNIQFSSMPIPEPGFLGLFGLGGLAFLWHCWKARKSWPRPDVARD
jgi:PEP-CTERM motif